MRIYDDSYGIKYYGESYEHLMPHNHVYSDKFQKVLKSSHVCALIQGTGTGKTYQILQVIHDMIFDSWLGKSSIKLLIVVPSDLLVSDWQDHLGKNGQFIRDLRDAEERERKGKTFESMGDIRFKYLDKSGAYSFDVITYQKLKNISGVTTKDEIGVLSPEQERKLLSFTGSYDLIAIDEIHHASDNTWYSVIKTLIEKRKSNQYIVGVTATIAKGERGTAELFNGNVVQGIEVEQAQDGSYEMYNDKGEKVKGGNPPVLPGVKRITSMVYDNSLSTCRALKNRYIDWIKKLPSIKDRKELLDQLDFIFNNLSVETYGKYARSQLLNIHPQKIICFYPRGENVSSVSKFIEKVFNISKIESVSSAADSEENRRKIEDFENTKEDTVILAMDMFNEGVHVSGVSAIVLLRKTFSGTKFRQMIGRAMSSKSKNLIIPVFDIAGNTAIAQDMADSDMDEMRKFLAGSRNFEATVPEFDVASRFLLAMEQKLLKEAGRPPVMRSDSDLKTVLYKYWGNINVFSNIYLMVDLHSIKALYKEFFDAKQQKDSSFEYNIDSFTDVDFQRALTLQKKNQTSPLLSILRAFVNRNGKFEDMSDLIAFCNERYGFSGATSTNLSKDIQANRGAYNALVKNVKESFNPILTELILEGFDLSILI